LTVEHYLDLATSMDEVIAWRTALRERSAVVLGCETLTELSHQPTSADEAGCSELTDQGSAASITPREIF
jgi:hypothetical protein